MMSRLHVIPYNLPTSKETIRCCGRGGVACLDLRPCSAPFFRHCSSDSVFDLDRPIDRFYTAAPNLFPQGAHYVRTGTIRTRPHRGDDQRQGPPRPPTRGVSSRPEADSLSPVLSSRLAAQIWTAHVACPG